MLANLENVIAIELLEATQAMDFRKPLTFGRGTSIGHRVVRERVAHLDADRNLSVDIAAARGLERAM